MEIFQAVSEFADPVEREQLIQHLVYAERLIDAIHDDDETRFTATLACVNRHVFMAGLLALLIGISGDEQVEAARNRLGIMRLEAEVNT